ncbi:MAG: hypothetical protein ACI8P3_002114 [Saprospiraceae bacterium]|jgi:hypothetical protein
MKNKVSFLTTVFFLFQSLSVYTQNGMALRLDGINDYMQVADHDDLDIDAGENFTFTLWMKTSADSDFYRIISKRANTGSNPGYEMITQSGVGAYGINLRSTTNTNSGPPFGMTSITDGGWHHLAMVVDVNNSTASIFVDGNMEQMSNSSAIGTESFANNVALLFGTNISQDNFINTLLDDVRLWQIALSDSEINADMTAVISGNEPDLIAAWDFENVTGTTVPGLTNNHNGTLFGGATTIDINAGMTYQSSEVITTTTPAGKGESDERIIAVNVIMQGNNTPLELTKVVFNLSGTSDLSDLENVKVYYTAGSAELLTTSLFGTATVQTGAIEVAGNQTLGEGFNHFWISADLSQNAAEGNVLKGEIESVTVDGQVNNPTSSTTSDERLILLEHKLLFSGGDYGAVNWRIPAVVTAADGSIIVAADARVDVAGDLPNNIDIVIRRSTDMGESWSDALTIVNFGQSGASDPALVLDRNTGDLLCMFASHTGLFQSTPSNPIRFQVCRSQDNGITWSAPQEFTNQIYASAWNAAWLASGSAHQMRNGRIIGAVGVREIGLNGISNFMIFSDDGGQSWDFNPARATLNGNEAKMMELDNGNLMMNIRNQTPDSRQIVISDDGGDNWGTPYFQSELIDPYVNGDLIRYTSVLDGFDKSRLLFSIAAHPTSRQNLTVFLSDDEGETWPVSKVIHPDASGYSSITILADGTIGCFYENGEYENYQLYFARFSLDWLSDGNDSYVPPTALNEQSLKNIEVVVFPNPADASLNIILDLTERTTIQIAIVNAAGQELLTGSNEHFNAGVHQRQVDIKEFSDGVYFLKIKTDEGVITRKFLVLR